MTTTVAARVEALFAPRAVAVVGASRDPAKLGSAMTRSLAGFAGPVVGVNPRDPDPAAGRYASLADAATAIDTPVDLAVLCVPAAASAAAVADAAAAGVRAALVCSGGYAETGGDGSRRQADLVAAARAGGVAVLGPNTSGFVVPARGLTASFVPGVETLAVGPVGVVAASGGVNHVLAFLLADAGLGVSLAVGLGNAADVGVVEVLDHLRTDDATRVVALHVESVADGPALTEAVRALSAVKPVVAFVVGRHDVAEFARSHTGALATSWRTTRAALRHAGAVLVEDERALVDAVAALSLTRLPARRATPVGVVTAQAGPGLVHVDTLRGARVEVPPLQDATVADLAELLPPLTFQRNPVDTGRPGDTFPAVLRAVAADPGVGLTSVYALLEPGVLDLGAALAAAGPGPFVVGLGGPADAVRSARDALRAAGIAAVDSPRALSTAVQALVDDAAAAALRSESVQSATVPPMGAPAAGWDEDAAKQRLETLGITTPPRRACVDRAAAHRALAELPAPVAVKVLDPAVLHKSDVGGVRLGVRTPTELDAALDALDALGTPRYLVESMADEGVDLVVGATRDPVFGPVVLVGLGGVTAEALADVAVAPAPLAPAVAATLAGDLAGRAVLDGFRGLPTVDRTELGAVLAALGDLLVADPTLETVEINPLRATRGGLIALDAVLTTRKEEAS